MLVGVLGQLVLSLKTIVVKTTRTILMSSKHAYVMISRLGCSHLGYLGEQMNKFVVAVLSMIVLRINRLLNISR